MLVLGGTHLITVSGSCFKLVLGVTIRDGRPALHQFGLIVEVELLTQRCKHGSHQCLLLFVLRSLLLLVHSHLGIHILDRLFTLLRV